MTQAYPLQWPDHIARTPMAQRVRSRFDVSPDRARSYLRAEAEKMGVYTVISTNVELRRDGEPYASRREPDDTGVAVYFERMPSGETVCLACDKFQHVWENMRALGKTLEAMRGIERWGSTELLNRAFVGFTALPPPDATQPPAPTPRLWFEVLDVSPSAPVEVISAAYKAKARMATEAELYDLNDAKTRGLNTAKAQS